MNRENMQKLRDQLARLREDQFHMNYFILHPDDHRMEEIGRQKPCGTVACIAGWCSILNGGPTEVESDAAVFAQDFLGLSIVEARHLFYGNWAGPLETLDEVTLPQAIAHLDELLS